MTATAVRRPATAPQRSPRAVRSPWLALIAFFALAAFAAAHWATFVANPPTARVAGAVAVATALGAALAAIGSADLPRAARHGAAALVSVAGLALALNVGGLPDHLLVPGNWSDLADGLDRGLSGIRAVDWPYNGTDEWVRRTILLGAPALLWLAGGAGLLAGPRASRGRSAGPRADCHPGRLRRPGDRARPRRALCSAA